jgi:signal transduction protein with GAF and PtsI domain
MVLHVYIAIFCKANKLLRIIVANAGKTPITLCGELAVTPKSLYSGLATGITTVSIAPASIPEIKDTIRHLKHPLEKGKNRR